MHLAITGATGNVGTAVLRAIRTAHPDWEITGIARRLPEDDAGFPYAGVRWRSIDISERGAETELADAFTGADAAVHLAWAIQPSYSPGVLESVNLDGSARVMRAATSARVRHLVHASSIGAYAPVPGGALPKPVTDETWPTTGVVTSIYSRHKATVERMLDVLEQAGGVPVVTRVRPGLVLQPDAGAEIGRYFVGVLAPLVRVVRRAVPVLPLPDGLVADAVHADDLADAVLRIVEREVGGAFNIGADDHIDPDSLAAAFGARRVRAPYAVLRAATALSWRLHLQPTDAGWLDLSRNVPLLDTTRAKTLLDWAPVHSAQETLAELVAAVGTGHGGSSPILAPR